MLGGVIDSEQACNLVIPKTHNIELHDVHDESCAHAEVLVTCGLVSSKSVSSKAAQCPS